MPPPIAKLFPSTFVLSAISFFVLSSSLSACHASHPATHSLDSSSSSNNMKDNSYNNDNNEKNNNGLGSEDVWPTGKVYELTERTLTEITEKFQFVLVDFYAPWCEHCKNLDSELDLAASLLVSQLPPVAIGKLNIERFPKIAAKYKITKYPSLFLFSNGNPEVYIGPQEASSMAAFLQRQLAPLIAVLPSEAAMDEYIKIHQGGPLGLFLGFGLEPMDLQKVAEKYMNKAWFAIYPKVSEQLMYKYDFDKGPALISIFARGEQDIFYGPFDQSSDLETFVHLNYLPPVMILNEATYPKITSSERPIALIIANFDNQAPISLSLDAPRPSDVDSPAGDAVRYARRCKPVARRHRKYVFAYVDASKYLSFLTPFGLSQKTPLPTILVWNGGTQFYEYEKPKEFRGEEMEFALSRFLNDIDSQRLSPKETKQSLPNQFWTIVKHPNFPMVIIAVLVACAIKLGKKGGNVLIPKTRRERSGAVRDTEERRDNGENNGENNGGNNKESTHGNTNDMSGVKNLEQKKKE